MTTNLDLTVPTTDPDERTAGPLYAQEIDAAVLTLEEVSPRSALAAEGVTADDAADDTPGLQDWIDNSPNGSLLYFPIPSDGGQYRIDAPLGIEVTSRVGLTFAGPGWDCVLHRVPSGVANSQRWFTFTSCTDIAFRDLAFDADNIKAFGGVAVYSTNGFTVDHCKGFDSNINATAPDAAGGGDHYWWVIQGSTDVTITRSQADDLELVEANNNRHVTVSTCVLNRPRAAAGIGCFAVNDDYIFEDHTIVDCQIFDPYQGGIICRTEGTKSNCTLRNFGIHNNVVKWVDTSRAYRDSGIQVLFQGTGHTLDVLEVTGNRVSVASGVSVSITGDAYPIMLQSDAGSPITSPVVTHNIAKDNTTPGIGYALSYSTLSGGIIGPNIAKSLNGVAYNRATNCQIYTDVVTATNVGFAWTNSGGGNRVRSPYFTTTPSTIFSGTKSAGDSFEGFGDTAAQRTLEATMAGAPSYRVGTSDNPTAVGDLGGRFACGFRMDLGNSARIATVAARCETDFGGGETFGTNPRVGMSFYVATPTGAVEGARVGSNPSDGDTALWVRRNVGGTLTIQKVTMGAADSGGSGYKLLRVPN